MEIIEIAKSFGFPAVIAFVLLWDKIKSNGVLKNAVDNNTRAINSIYKYLNRFETRLLNGRK